MSTHMWFACDTDAWCQDIWLVIMMELVNEQSRMLRTHAFVHHHQLRSTVKRISTAMNHDNKLRWQDTDIECLPTWTSATNMRCEFPDLTVLLWNWSQCTIISDNIKCVPVINYLWTSVLSVSHITKPLSTKSTDISWWTAVIKFGTFLTSLTNS